MFYLSRLVGAVLISALVLAPNLLRTTSDSLATVFTNSAFESKFVLNLLEHLDPRLVDPGYIPEHGRLPS